MAIADTVTVMRRGQAVVTSSVADTNPTTLAEMILGEPVIPTSVTRQQVEVLTPMLRLEAVTVFADSDTKRDFTRFFSRRGRKVQPSNSRKSNKLHLDRIELEVFPGEIVGIAGVEGNGQTELVEVLTGLRRIQSGRLTLNGERIAHIPADRHRHGNSLNDRIDDNFIIGHHKHRRYCRYGLLQRKSIQRAALMP